MRGAYVTTVLHKYDIKYIHCCGGIIVLLIQVLSPIPLAKYIYATAVTTWLPKIKSYINTNK